MNKKIIDVVGAGPAGLTASIILRKAGFNVNLYEKNEDVGLRFNGDYQGLENWSDKQDTLEILKDIGIETNFRCKPYFGSNGYFVGPDSKKIRVNSSRPMFYLIERGSGLTSLDQGLKKQAIELGVNILWGKKIDSIKDDFAIVGTGPKAADAIAKGLVFNTSAKNLFIGFLDNRIAPKGYAYLLVNEGRATFATCLFEDFKNEKEYFEKALNVFRSTININIDSPKEFGGFVNFFTQPVLGKDNKVIYIGENAGFQDALWGFGIKYAMLSGYYAAQSVIKDESYSDLIKKHLSPKLKTSLANRWLFSHIYNFGYNLILSHLETMDDVIPALNKHYNLTVSKRALFQVSKRWYKSRLIDKQCMHKNCDCVWCRHGKQAHSEIKIL